MARTVSKEERPEGEDPSKPPFTLNVGRRDCGCAYVEMVWNGLDPYSAVVTLLESAACVIADSNPAHPMVQTINMLAGMCGHGHPEVRSLSCEAHRAAEAAS